MAKVGDFALECKHCGAELLVPVSAELVENGDGFVYVRCSPDVSDVWLHMFVEHEDKRT